MEIHPMFSLGFLCFPSFCVYICVYIFRYTYERNRFNHSRNPETQG